MIKRFKIDGLALYIPRKFEDDRGYFFESFNEEFFRREIGNFHFKQDNQSQSSKGVLRGLHFQAPPYEQGKLIQVLNGRVLDVIVDLRIGSKTFGKHMKIELSSDNRKQLWIPPGFAHGFLTLENDTLFSYKCTNHYSKNHEMDLLWNDENLNIDWGIENPIISEKDKRATKFKELNSPF